MKNLVDNFGIFVGMLAHFVGLISLFTHPRSAIVFAFPAGIVMITIALLEIGMKKKAWKMLGIQIILYVLLIIVYVELM